MFSQLPQIYKKHAARYMKLVCAAKEHPVPLLTVALAANDTQPVIGTSRRSAAQVVEYKEATRIRITSRCMGLLEVDGLLVQPLDAYDAWAEQIERQGSHDVDLHRGRTFEMSGPPEGSDGETNSSSSEGNSAESGPTTCRTLRQSIEVECGSSIGRLWNFAATIVRKAMTRIFVTIRQVRRTWRWLLPRSRASKVRLG